MDKIEIIGFVAGFVMIFSFLPQFIKTYKTKRANDLSKFMLILQMTCISLWVVYGFFKQSQSLIISNLISLIIVVCVFIMKLNYDRKSK
ncbi:SemiSWEET family sugar transporter [Clostridium akagii]|uniref:SemiSWEET family sugar transporter n=1 Tax=Clostridium akagii TaxID=91623 RepID=UPI0004790D2D|nr:SemiSWEET family transporter [Clostridium akagii]